MFFFVELLFCFIVLPAIHKKIRKYWNLFQLVMECNTKRFLKIIERNMDHVSSMDPVAEFLKYLYLGERERLSLNLDRLSLSLPSLIHLFFFYLLSFAISSGVIPFYIILCYLIFVFYSYKYFLFKKDWWESN